MKWQRLGHELPIGGNRLTTLLGRTLFRAMGWRIEGEFPNYPKMVVAVAPHTSNVDFIVAIAVVWGLGLRASYLAKRSLFRFPLGPMMTALGGIPVDRSSSQGLVEQLAQQFESRSKLVLGITPEGTRSSVKSWKSGFALIAQAANVPVLPAILDLQNKVVRFESLITDVGDSDNVIATVRALANPAQQAAD